MRKRNHFRQLGRTPSHKMAMLRNMVTSLIEHERIVTTLAKAKEVQRLAEKVITMAKRATVRASSVLLLSSNNNNTVSTTTKTTVMEEETSIRSDGDLSSSKQTNEQQKQLYNIAASQFVHAHRQIGRIVRTDLAVQKVMNVLRHRYDVRVGGYTRIMKLSKPRAGDNADMAIIEYVDHANEVRAARPPPIITVIPDGNIIHHSQSHNTHGKLSSIQIQQQLETLKNIHTTTQK